MCRIVERSAVHQKDVKTAIVVVVEKRYTRTHRFDQILFGCVRGLVFEADSSLFGDIYEVPSYDTGTAGKTLRVLRKSQARNHDCGPPEQG
jgi:hypothetical protein